jgi:formylglycine-generating enzyme required for sulfatase activity
MPDDWKKAAIFQLIILCLLTGCANTAARSSADEVTETPLPDLDGDPPSLGYAMVNRNDAWTPHTESIGGVEMALVPAGCFTLGSTDEQVDDAWRYCEALRGEGRCFRNSYQNEQPAIEHCFDEPFWIDVYEVTNAQYGSSGEWEGGELPREQVNWVEAMAHCESRGARLPTEVEWEYAARGPDGLVFPWGNEFDRSLLNSCDRDCIFNLIGIRAEDGFAYTAPVGSYPDGASWVGAMDMSGNVWEWTFSPYESYAGSRTALSDSMNDTEGTRMVLRGGSWMHCGADLLRSAARYPVSPEYADRVHGFRCVIPSP